MLEVVITLSNLNKKHVLCLYNVFTPHLVHN